MIDRKLHTFELAPVEIKYLNLGQLITKVALATVLHPAKISLHQLLLLNPGKVVN